MADHYRTPDEIERDLERERAGLSATLADIGNRLSLDELAHSVGDQAKYYATDVSQTAQRVVRENPLGVALTGLGVAWLLFGATAREKVRDMRSSDLPPRSSSYRANPGAPYDASQAPAYGTSRRDPYQGYAGTRDQSAGWADDREWEDTDFELAAEDSDSSPTFLDRIWSAVGSAKDKVSELGESVQASVHDASHAVSDTGRRSQAGFRHRARMTRDASRRMQDRLSAGTEHLSEGARARVIAARERAVAARREAMVLARARGRDAARGFDSYPLAGGAVALAVGAAIAAVVPRTRFEDEYFGERSDELYARAEEVFREERERAERVARAALDEAGKVATDVREDLAEGAQAARDDAAGAADRIADRAKGAAQSEKGSAQSEPKQSGTQTH